MFPPSGVCICGFARTPLPDHLVCLICMRDDHMCIAGCRVPSDLALKPSLRLFLRASALVGTGDHQGKMCLDAVIVTLGKHELFGNIHLFTGPKKSKKLTSIILELFWVVGFMGGISPGFFFFSIALSFWKKLVNFNFQNLDELVSFSYY